MEVLKELLFFFVFSVGFEAASLKVDLLNELAERVFDIVYYLIPSKFTLIRLTRPLQRFNQKLDYLITQTKALDIDELNQLSKYVRRVANKIKRFPIQIPILNLLPQVILHVFIVILAE